MSGSNNKNDNNLDLNIDITPDRQSVAVSVYNKTDDFNFHELLYLQSSSGLEQNYSKNTKLPRIRYWKWSCNSRVIGKLRLNYSHSFH